MPSTETTDPIWNVGDIHSNFKRRFQERNERYGRLIDRIYIGRKIRMTVARMTRNYHSNRSSEEDHGLPSTSQANLLQDMIPGGDGADPQLGPVCQFGMDSRDAIDSVNRGSQILREIQNDAEMHTGSIKNIPSPGLKPKCEAALDKTLADTIKLREIYEKIVEQAENDNTRASQSVKHQEKSDVDKISELKSCNSNMVWLEYLKKFTVNSKFAIASSADHIITSGKQSDESKWTVNAAEDDILLSMIRGSSSNSERNPAPGALEEEAETESWTRRKSRKVAGKTVSYDDAEFYRSSEEWKEETLDVFRSLCEPRPSCLAQPPEESIKKQNQDFETFPSTYIIDHVLEDSRALRTFGGYASFSTFQAGEASMTSKMSNSARRRVVSTAAVQVQFPVTRNVVPQIETFDSRSEAIAALCEYKLSQLSNFVVYDPAKRMFYAQNGEYTPPSSAVLIEKRLELVWLPLQPDSLSKAAEADNREDKQSGSSTQENKMEQPLVTEDSKETASVCRLFTAHNSLVGESNFCTSDSAIGNEGASKVQSSIMIADLVDNLPGDSANQKRENEWTLSDEEYVVQMDPATALEHLGSDYANSVCSTPKLVKGTLLYPRILLSGEDDWYDSEDSFNLRSTPTWTQLGREFRARHPEILSRSKCSSFEDNSEVSSYDTEFESSSPGCSESGNWSRQVKDPYCPIRNDPLRLNESFETGERDLGRNPSYDNLTGIAEHVEDITSDVNGNTLWRKLEESGVLATTTPNNTDNAEHVADGDRYYELGIHAKCDHLQCRTGSGESSSEPGSIASWRSWVEAELVQSALYQPLPWLPLRNSEDSTGNKSTYSSQDTQSLSREPKILSQPKVLDELKQDGPANSTSGSGPTRHRSSSVKSFAAGFRFTAFSEYMPEERGHPVEPSLDLSGSEHMLGEHKPPVESSLGSNDSERALPIILQPEPHISACEKRPQQFTGRLWR
ncbi:hypothetical protein BDZ45DRAFT_376875 [Acephala macrosclerotiorum]|nr:hypothetical protein BDZ45DRAFT_376875 [Acephala macrosclerotiorum]